METTTTIKKATPRMVTIKIPVTRTEKDDVYVAVNGRSFLIKRGEPVVVPEYVKKVLDEREEALGRAMAHEAELQSRY